MGHNDLIGANYDIDSLQDLTQIITSVLFHPADTNFTISSF